MIILFKTAWVGNFPAVELNYMFDLLLITSCSQFYASNGVEIWIYLLIAVICQIYHESYIKWDIISLHIHLLIRTSFYINTSTLKHAKYEQSKWPSLYEHPSWKSPTLYKLLTIWVNGKLLIKTFLQTSSLLRYLSLILWMTEWKTSEWE